MLIPRSHGYDSLMFNRQDYLQMLVESLPECDERVKIGRQVTGVETTASGVSVRFEDGTSETGSIVIGADGIWSVVRRELERLSGDKIFEPEYTGYSGIYGHGGAVEGLMPWTGHERHDYGEDGFGIQVFTTPTKTFFGSFRRIPVSKGESGNDGTFKRYTEADADAFAESLLDVPLYKGVKFGDIWKEKELYGMTQIHSGMAKQWHWSRLVLVGDSAHKVSGCATLCCKSRWLISNGRSRPTLAPVPLWASSRRRVSQTTSTLSFSALPNPMPSRCPRHLPRTKPSEWACPKYGSTSQGRIWTQSYGEAGSTESSASPSLG